jgi:hypothetical protein
MELVAQEAVAAKSRPTEPEALAEFVFWRGKSGSASTSGSRKRKQTFFG